MQFPIDLIECNDDKWWTVAKDEIPWIKMVAQHDVDAQTVSQIAKLTFS